jgi:regulator of sirC expression with transglutaminase-like and TPR domain
MSIAPYAEGPEFVRLVRGDERADLTRLTLEIARDAYPELDPAACLDRLDRLADRVRDRCRDGARLNQILGQINWVLFTEEGFRGNDDDYYDPRNSYLNDVLDRKLGIPISLSVLYMAVAQRIGLPMSGVNLPGHFVIRTGFGGTPTFVDPFHQGLLLDRAGCVRRVAEVTGQSVELDDDQLAPCPVSTIIARMLRNLKAVYLRDGDFASSLPVMRRLVALTNGHPIERRDLGVACLHAERPGEAIDHLEAYLDARPHAADFRAVNAMLRAAWRDVAASN